MTDANEGQPVVGGNEAILKRSPLLRTFLSGKELDRTQWQEALRRDSQTLLNEVTQNVGGNWQELVLGSLREYEHALGVFKVDVSDGTKTDIVRSTVLIGYEIGERARAQMFVSDLINVLAKQNTLDEITLRNPDRRQNLVASLKAFLFMGDRLRHYGSPHYQARDTSKIPSPFFKAFE